MRKKSTRLLSAALAVCMMLSVLPVGAFAAEPGAEEQENGASAQADPVDSELVEINSTNFPDPVFQQYVKDNIDKADTTGQKDGKLSKTERDAVTEISITNTNCTDLTGIAYFANLTTLECQHNGLKELNLEYNKSLTDLNCSYNQLTTLDVSKNAKLRILECYNNSIAELNLGDINGIPRVLDAGQCNDSYSLAVIAMKLKEVFELNDINELPIVYNIAWYEQKAVIVLLALLSLGVKKIHLGPTLPAFLSPNAAKVLVDTFQIDTISDVEDDLKMFQL